MLKKNVLIYGQVQGVGFRYWVKGKLKEMGLEGEAWNNEDKTVEAWFEGEKRAVEQMIKLCHEGPPLAKVKKVVIL
ncbi:MAG: acylphosphatase [Candidatus Beckwithbacteria bacterium]